MSSLQYSEIDSCTLKYLYHVLVEIYRQQFLFVICFSLSLYVS